MKNIIYIFIGLVLAIKLGVLTNPFQSKPDMTGLPLNEVVIYSTAWCGYCTKAKNLMDGLEIKYVEYDIENSPEGKAQYKQLNGRGVPLVLINGELVKGYNPKRMKKLFKEHNKSNI